MAKQWKFKTMDSKYQHLNGKSVIMLRPLTSAEADLEETGPMYKIKIGTTELDCFEDELIN